jgi:hypothetical protein
MWISLPIFACEKAFGRMAIMGQRIPRELERANYRAVQIGANGSHLPVDWHSFDLHAQYAPQFTTLEDLG